MKGSYLHELRTVFFAVSVLAACFSAGAAWMDSQKDHEIVELRASFQKKMEFAEMNLDDLLQRKSLVEAENSSLTSEVHMLQVKIKSLNEKYAHRERMSGYVSVSPVGTYHIIPGIPFTVYGVWNDHGGQSASVGFGELQKDLFQGQTITKDFHGEWKCSVTFAYSWKGEADKKDRAVMRYHCDPLKRAS